MSNPQPPQAGQVVKPPPSKSSWRNQTELVEASLEPLFRTHKEAIRYMREVSDSNHDPYLYNVQQAEQRIIAVMRELDKMKAALTARFFK